MMQTVAFEDIASEAVPAGVVQAVLMEYLADEDAALTNVDVAPIPGDGFSGNRLYRVRLCWESGRRGSGPGSVDWVVKRWLPGGYGEALLGVTRPLEALAWEKGLLRREALPAGVATPIVGAKLEAAGAGAWIVMEDVATALGEYSRERPLPAPEALARTKQVLDGLARLHAWSERPEQRARLRSCPWLVPAERFLRAEAPAYAAALGRAGRPAGPNGRAVTDELRTDLRAFLDWLPAGDRRLWERLLCDREPLVAAFRSFPDTLLHGDTDDRNIGLRPASIDPALSGGAEGAGEVVLIDWEWIGKGPPALDFARVWGTFAAVCDRGTPPPAALSSAELPDYYYERYAAAGGTLTDRETWRRSYPLAALAAALTQVAFFGRMARDGVQPVLAVLERQMELLTTAKQYLD
jgi:hypothetical protein